MCVLFALVAYLVVEQRVHLPACLVGELLLQLSDHIQVGHDHFAQLHVLSRHDQVLAAGIEVVGLARGQGDGTGLFTARGEVVRSGGQIHALVSARIAAIDETALGQSSPDHGLSTLDLELHSSRFHRTRPSSGFGIVRRTQE